MPVRDTPGHYLRAAVLSMLRQTEPDFELLVVDDGSAGLTQQRLAAWARRDARIRLLRLERSHGVTGALNVGLQAARGRFIARMDADDISAPDRLARQVRFLEVAPSCVAVGTDLLFIDPDGRPLRVWPQPAEHEEIERRMLAGEDGVIGHPSVLMRSEAVREVGGYDERFAHSQDLDLFLRLAERGQLANMNEPLLYYRQHLGAVSFAKLESQWQCKRRIVEEARQRRGLPPLNLAGPRSIPSPAPGWFYLRWARMAWRGEHYASTLRYGLAAAAHLPWEWQSWWERLRHAARRAA